MTWPPYPGDINPEYHRAMRTYTTLIFIIGVLAGSGIEALFFLLQP